MKGKVTKFIKDNELLDKGDRVLVGVSGGPDSIALLHFLNDIKDDFSLELFVCHVNHMIRGEEADGDEEFVKNICNELSIEFYSKKVDIMDLAKSRKTSIEETGREERFQFFYSIKKAKNIDKIALGHHKGDHVETIFMRFIRGTGIKGLRGIQGKREDGVVRPFLCVTKEEILQYSRLLNIASRIDVSNFETDYHRNKLRLEVIPYMEELNPNFSTNIERLGIICHDYYDFVQYHLEIAQEKAVHNGKILISAFNDLHQVLQSEILIKLLSTIDESNSVEFHHINRILHKLKDSDSTTWSMDLPKGIKVFRQYEYLFPQKMQDTIGKEEYDYPCFPNKTYVFPKLEMTIQFKLINLGEYNTCQNTKYTGFFDYDRILSAGSHLHLRNRNHGDKIEPVGLIGSKKIKELLIDKKIPSQTRWKIPLFCVDKVVIWVVGYHRSRTFTPSENTRRILKVSYCKHEEEKDEK